MKTSELISELVDAIASTGDGEIRVQNENGGEEYPIVEVNTETGDVWLIVKDSE